MNKGADHVLEKMMDDAIDEVAKKGWKNASQKAVTMACYGIMKDDLRNQRGETRAAMKPVWWLIGVLSAGIVWQMVNTFFLT